MTFLFYNITICQILVALGDPLYTNLKLFFLVLMTCHDILYFSGAPFDKDSCKRLSQWFIQF